ncbi:MAG TPA: hypothetical protein VHD62_07295 [Opitutaceae bacterium]|nr:hypothetical protein [Opitutaceae bacterium]
MEKSRQIASLFALCLSAAGLLAQPAAASQTKIAAPAAPLFAEDFETGALNPAVWTKSITGDNRVEVQREKVAHGSFALRVRCPAPSNKTWAFIMAQHIPEALREHHFGRAYMFITPKPPARHTILVMAGRPGFPFNRYEEVATSNTRWQLTYVDLRQDGTEEDYHSGGVVPVGRWFCLEWEFNDHSNHIAVTVDGQPVYESGFVSKRTRATTDLVGGFDEFALGFRLWGAAPEAFDVYYDDVALDTKPIGLIAGPLAKP